MKRVSPAYYDLGRWLLAQEAGAREDSTAMVEAAEAIFQKLRARLITIFGKDGFYSLLGRALHIAKVQQPLLKAVEVEPLHNSSAAGAHLRGLRESLAGSDAESVVKALVTLIGSFAWLLASFIGQDMAWRELQRIWPATYFPEAGSDSEEAKQ